MILMAVESSCDETAVALVEDGRRVLTDCIASQVDLHRIYGGVVPEIASRKHIEAIYGLADQALVRAGLKRKDVDGIAVTYAPGLIGAVLVGVNFAKGAALALDVPLIPVHHIRGHIAANTSQPTKVHKRSSTPAACKKIEMTCHIRLHPRSILCPGLAQCPTQEHITIYHNRPKA